MSLVWGTSLSKIRLQALASDGPGESLSHIHWQSEPDTYSDGQFSYTGNAGHCGTSSDLNLNLI